MIAKINQEIFTVRKNIAGIILKIFRYAIKPAKALLLTILVIPLTACFISKGNSPIIDNKNASYPLMVGSQSASLVDEGRLERRLEGLGLTEYIPDDFVRRINLKAPLRKH
jgi:hypothetical protein